MSPNETIPPKKTDVTQESDSDHTLIMPMPVDPSGTPTIPTAAPVEDLGDDRTLLLPMPSTPVLDSMAQDADEDDGDRTLLMAVSPASQPSNTAALLQTPTSEGNEGSTYRPFSDGTPPPSIDGDGEPKFSTGVAPAAGIGRTGPLTESISTDTSRAPTPLRTLETGAVINNMYRVEERIDHGGMGRVFRGVEIGTGESVAIKVILPEMAEDPRVAQMFRREASTLRQLHHDAIVRYFAYVPPDANFNLHALVMGFIEGTKLSDKIKNDGPLSEKQACALFTRLAGGLERAHEIGVVHRDLSPDNVMLPGNDINKALLIDFGISRSSKLKEGTIGNEFAGKLKYVSPEQLGAFGGETDGRSDVYSFGLLMIITLTGQPLAMGDSITEAVQKRQSVPDLSKIPVNFQSMLYEMLQPDPGQRMKSMLEVISNLRIISGDEVTSMTPDNRVVAGLQAAPRVNPIGGGFVTTSPTVGTQAESPEESGGGIGKMIGIVTLLAALSGGAWYAMGMPSIYSKTADTETTGDVLTRVVGGHETFLAETFSAPCSYATLRIEGANAGQIEGFSDNPSVLENVTDGFFAEFGMRPNLIAHKVGMAQCAALDFVKTFQGTTGGTIEMELDASTVSRSVGVVGRIHGSAGRKNWLGLVGPNGRVFSLMSQLADPIGEQRHFSFRLRSAQPGTYLLISTASDVALIRAGAMVDGTQASDILPLMMKELSKNRRGGVDIAAIEITR